MGTLANKVASDIGKRIEEGKLKEGEKLLSERELAIKHEVSRPVIREAIGILKAKGLANVRVGKGIYVTRPQPIMIAETIQTIMKHYNTSMENVLEVRLELERSIVKKAVQHATAEDIKKLYKLHDEMEQERGNLTSYIELDIKFHLTIAKSTRNPLFHILLQTFIEMTQYVLFSLMELLKKQANLSQKQHLELIQAIEAKDEKQALEVISSHMQVIHNEIEELKKENLI